MSLSFDVLGLGGVTIDDLIYVESYPPPDTKMPVLQSVRQCGGLTATALVAAARLGSRCAYAGVLGDDELSRFVNDRLEEEGIETGYILRRPDACPIHSRIIVDSKRQTRNIFFELKGRVGADPGWPEAAVIRSARVLFVDHYGMEGQARAARLARQAQVPVVADLERRDPLYFPELFNLVDHLIISQNFAHELTGESNPAAALAGLWHDGRQAVVITCGAQGSWYQDRATGQRPRHQPAYPVQVVDTTGCGDVFHGAYASGLAQDLDLPARVRLASAAAALKATQPGGQAGIPTLAVVEAFLLLHSSKI